MERQISEILEDYEHSFPKAYREGNLVFAYHAAFPIFLTSQLLYQLWLNFKYYQNTEGQARLISYTAISDFIHSDLCEQVGFDLYEVPRDVRKSLLEELSKDRRFTNEHQNRQDELANFTYQYADIYYSHPKRQNMKDVLQWTALVALDRDYAANKMREFLENKEQKYSNKALLRLHLLINELQEQDDSFNELIEYSAVLTTQAEEGDTTLLKVPARLKNKMSEKVIEEMRQQLEAEQTSESALEEKVFSIREQINHLRRTFERILEMYEGGEYISYFVEGIILNLYHAQLDLYTSILDEGGKSLEELQKVEQLVQLLDEDRIRRNFYVNRVGHILKRFTNKQGQNFRDLFLDEMYFYLGQLEFLKFQFNSYKDEYEGVKKGLDKVIQFKKELAPGELDFLKWQFTIGFKIADRLNEFDSSELEDEAAIDNFEHALQRYEDDVMNIKMGWVRLVLPQRMEQSYESLHLDISDCKLEALPSEISQLDHLESLVLGKKEDTTPNEIRELPRDFMQLRNLKQLVYQNNVLQYFPTFITFLPNLEELDLSHNQLTELPIPLVEMSSLQRLYFENNPLKEPPTFLSGASIDKVRRYLKRELLEEQYVSLNILSQAITELEEHNYPGCLDLLRRIEIPLFEVEDELKKLEELVSQWRKEQESTYNPKIQQQANFSQNYIFDQYAKDIHEAFEDTIEKVKQLILSYDILLQSSGETEIESASEVEEDLFATLRDYIQKDELEQALHFLEGYASELEDTYIKDHIGRLFEELDAQKEKLSKKVLSVNEYPLDFKVRIESLAREVELVQKYGIAGVIYVAQRNLLKWELRLALLQLSSFWGNNREFLEDRLGETKFYEDIQGLQGSYDRVNRQKESGAITVDEAEEAYQSIFSRLLGLINGIEEKITGIFSERVPRSAINIPKLYWLYNSIVKDEFGLILENLLEWNIPNEIRTDIISLGANYAREKKEIQDSSYKTKKVEDQRISISRSTANPIYENLVRTYYTGPSSVTEILDFIREGKPQDALTMLKSFELDWDKNKLDQLLAIEDQWVKAQTDRREGEIDMESYAVDWNKMMFSLIKVSRRPPQLTQGYEAAFKKHSLESAFAELSNLLAKEVNLEAFRFLEQNANQREITETALLWQASFSFQANLFYRGEISQEAYSINLRTLRSNVIALFDWLGYKFEEERLKDIKEEKEIETSPTNLKRLIAQNDHIGALTAVINMEGDAELKMLAYYNIARWRKNEFAKEEGIEDIENTQVTANKITLGILENIINHPSIQRSKRIQVVSNMLDEKRVHPFLQAIYYYQIRKALVILKDLSRETKYQENIELQLQRYNDNQLKNIRALFTPEEANAKEDEFILNLLELGAEIIGDLGRSWFQRLFS